MNGPCSCQDVVIVGLGNPGERYQMTRHNMGYLVVGQIAEEKNWKFKEEKRFLAAVAKGKIEERTVHLLLPRTYMNESGHALQLYLDFYRFDIKQVIAVVDDISLDFGVIRVRASGSSGGHNGLKSIQAHIGKDYVRMRVGIGRHSTELSLTEHVLDAFSREETKQLPSIINNGVAVINRLIEEDVSAVMNSINKRIKVGEINVTEKDKPL